MTTGLLDRLRTTKRTRQREAVETIHRLAQKAASGKLTKADDDALVNAIAQANLSDDDFAQLVNDLRRLREHEQQAAELEELKSSVAAQKDALRAFDERRQQEVARLDQQRAELERELKATQARLRRATEAAGAADEIKVKHNDIISDDDDRDLDHYNIRLPDGGFGAQGNDLPGAPAAILGRTRYGREVAKRAAIRWLALSERLRAHEDDLRKWRNGTTQRELAEARAERDERARMGAGVPDELDERISRLSAKSTEPPQRPALPTWAELVKHKKELARLTDALHERMSAESLARDEDGYQRITEKLRDEMRGGTPRK